MGRKRNIILENVVFHTAGAKGVAVGKTIEGKTVMANYVVPGDVADVMVTKSRKKFIQGKAIRFSKLSPYRVEPKCVHFGICGGCKWQNISYKEQVRLKQNEVVENLKRIGMVENFEIEPIIESEQEYYYRNKMEFSFSNAKWLTTEEVEEHKEIENKNALGFHIPGMWSKVLNLDECHLQKEPSNSIRLAVRDYAYEHGLDFFDFKKQEGFLRTLLIRTSQLGEIMVLFQFYKEEKEKIKHLLTYIKSQFPSITSLLYTINNKGNDSIYDLHIQLYDGRPYIEETMGNKTFRIGSKSFFQTNTPQAEKLYEKVLEYADLKGNEVVYDLYTGTGTIAIYLADKCAQVIGVESVSEAVEAAKINASDNGIKNCLFFCGDMKDVLTPQFFRENKAPDVVVVDPPRDGMHKNVVQALIESGVSKIIYVSCNSATQARDLSLMKDYYQVQKICPVDMFPQTQHVENIALLIRNVITKET